MSDQLVPLKPDQYPVTSLPKFTTDLPFFYHTKKKELLTKAINFQGSDAEGRPLRWQVTPSTIGAPGIDAHEVWTRLIKPRSDEQRTARSSRPAIVPLGSVRECLRTLDWKIGGWEQEHFFKCVKQICFAGCDADFWMPTAEKTAAGRARYAHVKGSFSRMTLYAIGSTHITEEELSRGKFTFDFDLGDTVYIQLHPLEVLLQSHQPQRPVDNEYLFSVNPAARRWYELLAPAFYGVTNNRGPGFCEIRYSWYVRRHHTLKRQTERRRVVQQMSELIKDHMSFGYVAKVEYRAVQEPGQETDYVIRYYPGAAVKESTRRIRSQFGRKKRAVQLTLPMAMIEELTTPAHQPPPEGDDAIVEQLRKYGVTEMKARELVKNHRAATEAQLAAYPYREGRARKNAAGWLVAAIEGNYTLPALYLEAQERKQHAAKAKEGKAATQACQLCDSNGWRRIRTSEHLDGAMKRCSHDPQIEAKYAVA